MSEFKEFVNSLSTLQYVLIVIWLFILLGLFIGLFMLSWVAGLTVTGCTVFVLLLLVTIVAFEDL